jgi:hypothetical protein
MIPGAGSTDGRTFQAHGAVGPELPGDLVVLRPPVGPPVLGQLLGAHREDGLMVREGAVLGTLDPDGAIDLGTTAPFA